MYCDGNGCHGSDRYRVGASEDNPEPDPSDGEAHVHGVPYEAVETYHY